MQEAAYCWRPELQGPKLLDDFATLPPAFMAGALKTIVTRRAKGLEMVPFFDIWKVQICSLHDHNNDIDAERQCKLKNAVWQKKLDDIPLQWRQREHVPDVVEDDSETAMDSE